MVSGPVAGVIGAAKLGDTLGYSDLISFDMGGTTAKTSLVHGGEPRIVTGYHIGGYASGHPMALPVVDIVEVGTGGGSIAWLDASGGLKVGPLSAGASPGPVCYGLGGTEPTVTDANLILGRLDPGNFLGGGMPLDLERARHALAKRVAEPLGMSIEQAALGILKIADTKMALAVREVSVAKGHDPREFAIVASGGAGPLHAGSIARELAIPRVIVPELPGTFSAVGMLLSDVRHDYVQTYIAPLERVDPEDLEEAFARLETQGLETLAEENVAAADSILARSMDLRYQGQEYTLGVGAPGPASVQSLAAVRRAFDERHEAHYRHAAPQESVEIVNLRVTAVGRIAMQGAELLSRRQVPARTRNASKHRAVFFDQGYVDCAVHPRAELSPEVAIEGPAVIEEEVSTTLLFPGDRATLHELGPIIIEVKA
jgi:N-methylhydantoinase A